MSREWRSVSGSASPAQQLKDLVPDLLAEGCLLQQPGESSVVRGDDPGPVLSVAVKDPAGGEKARALVALAERLRAGDCEGGRRSGFDGIGEPFQATEGTADSLEVVWLVEPLVVTTGGAIEGNHQLE